jgi:hypothetical protein
LSAEIKAAAKEELVKVFKLASQGYPVEMFSTAIDDVWHEMLGDKRSYEEFSISACGAVIGHAETSGQGLISFVKAYESAYGKLPAIWFTQRNGTFDDNRYRQYITSGVVTAGWDCTPTHNCARIVTT